MTYTELRPPADLAPWLACAWERSTDDGPPVRVLPDGCIDIVWIEGVDTQLVGPNTTAFLVDLPPGTRVAGARLRPGAAGSLLGVAAEGILDARIPVADVWAGSGSRLAASLDQARDPVDGILRWLSGRLTSAPAPAPDQLVEQAIRALGRPGVVIDRLAAELGVSERQLRRRVRAAVGYGPKRLARVLRLQTALAAGWAGEELGPAALDAGYADQSHFANDCRALAGASPTAVLARS